MKTLRPSAVLAPLAALLFAATAAHAQAQAPSVGTVATLSGMLVSRGADGTSRVLAVDSQVREGDTLSTQAHSFARIVFKDDAEVVLQPDSMLVLTRYAYDADKPQQDRVELGLAQGGMRSTAGKLALRNADATVIRTPMGSLQGRATVVVSLAPPQ